MARRRYISTEISTDKAIRDLAVQHGDFSALLYTWMVPHADDQGLITNDAEEILWTVASSFRHKVVEEVRDALDGMLRIGLIEDYDERRYAFPYESFYRYQSYIPENKRRIANDPINEAASPDDAGNQRVTPMNTDEQRQSPENPAYPSPSPSVKPSPSVSPSPSEVSAPEGDAQDQPPQFEPHIAEIAETLIQAPWVGDDLPDVMAAVDRSLKKAPWFNGARDGPMLAEQYATWPKYRKKPPVDWYRAWTNWLKGERNDDRTRTPHTKNGTAPHTGSAPRPLYDDPNVKPVTEAYIRHREPRAKSG